MKKIKVKIAFPELFQEVAENIFCIPEYAYKYGGYNGSYHIVQHRLYEIDKKDVAVYKKLILQVMELAECGESAAVEVLKNHSFWAKPMRRVDQKEIDYLPR